MNTIVLKQGVGSLRPERTFVARIRIFVKWKYKTKLHDKAGT